MNPKLLLRDLLFCKFIAVASTQNINEIPRNFLDWTFHLGFPRLWKSIFKRYRLVNWMVSLGNWVVWKTFRWGLPEDNIEELVRLLKIK